MNFATIAVSKSQDSLQNACIRNSEPWATLGPAMENQKCRRHTLSSVPDITKTSWIMNPGPFLACGELHGWCEQLIHTKTCFPAASAKSSGRARLTCATATGLQKFDHPEADPSPPGGGTPSFKFQVSKTAPRGEKHNADPAARGPQMGRRTGAHSAPPEDRRRTDPRPRRTHKYKPRPTSSI